MDYRFIIRCWQEQAGDENAKANIFVDGTQVVTEQEITATSSDAPQIIAWESTGLADAIAARTPDENVSGESVTFDIKVVLVNEYYVDSSTDRNIMIDGMGYLCKQDGVYKRIAGDNAEGGGSGTGLTTITDFNNWDAGYKPLCPIAVTGSQIPDGWWDSRENAEAFYTIPVWGDPEDVGTTMTVDCTYI